jgi:D-alanine-D-alanine ligase
MHTVAIICGGQSPEHEISLMSAKNILNALDKNKFKIEIIYIDKKGHFRYANHHINNLENLPSENLPELAIIPGYKNNSFAFKDNLTKTLNIDIAFPILHGQLGEDGTIQGLFKMCNIPFVGNDVLGSAISMDKDVLKRLLRDAGINIPKFLTFYRHQKHQINFEQIISELNLPFFMKPTNAGSSIGISKIKNKNDFELGLSNAFKYDEKIIIEEYIKGREIECAVLGDAEPIASITGEIIPHHEFYTYEAKYFDENGASVIVPAEMSLEEVKKFQEIAIKTFQVLCCSGLARVDFFYDENKNIFLNEINTIPGFTNISMYPKCFEASGISYSHLVEKLILLGLKKQRIFDK